MAINRQAAGAGCEARFRPSALLGACAVALALALGVLAADALLDGEHRGTFCAHVPGTACAGAATARLAPRVPAEWGPAEWGTPDPAAPAPTPAPGHGHAFAFARRRLQRRAVR